MNLNPDDFRLFRDFIYDKTGIFFSPSKKYMLGRRLARRMEELNCETLKDYYRLLRLDMRGNEVNRLIEIITTNETYFFRNIAQMKILGEELLPRLILEKKQQNSKTLKIWSAACSTGEEPYSIAINILENLPDTDGWNIQVLASDINHQVLDTARKGKYSARALKEVHSYYLSKYFIGNNGTYEVDPRLKKLVRFFYLNLMDSQQAANIRNIDIVFCRNVLIYFDQKARRQVVGHLYNSLRSEGHIFLGHSESMSRISTAFKICRFSNGIIYQKQ